MPTTTSKRGGAARVPSRLATRFRVELLAMPCPIWREILVSASYSFWDLHVAIQDAIGWSDTHLHEFRVEGEHREIGIGLPSGEEDDPPLPGWTEKIGRYFVEAGAAARYIYDFGDDWEHRLTYLGNEVGFPGGLPACVGGAGHHPPEDFGGPYGFQEFLHAMKDPKHPSHKAQREWYGWQFDPADFDANTVVFGDPKKRLKIARSTR